MKKLFDSLEGGSVERQTKKKTTVMLIIATVILIAVLLCVLLVSSIVTSIKDKKAADEGSGGDSSGVGNVGYVAKDVDEAQIHSGSLVLVNADNEYIFADNPEVVSFPPTSSLRYGLRDTSLKVNPTALSAFNELMDATYAAIPGAKVVVREAYRSFDDQAAKHEKNPNEALPAGYSDFHTGMSFELQDGDSWVYINDKSLNGKYNWLYENAHKYGFIVRYPDNIPVSDTGKNSGKDFAAITGVTDFGWVLRYVGIAHATYIYNNELCLEEYLDILREQHSFGSSLTVKGGDGRSYEIYYATADEAGAIQVPEKYTYEISGDNESGYIVTVNKSKTVKNT